jgi:four helix bundle protein
VSIPANLAEGSSRGTDPDFARFVSVAMGSASEVEYLLLLAHDLRYLDTVVHETLANQTTEVKRMLASLLKKLRADGR